MFEAGELEQTVRAAEEPYRTLFTVAALTGARLSELLALRWGNLRLGDPEDAEIEFAYQVNRRRDPRSDQDRWLGAYGSDSERARPDPEGPPSAIDVHRA